MNDLFSPIQIYKKEGEQDNCYWKLIINTNFQELFQQEGLENFQAFYNLPQGDLIKKIKERSVVRFKISGLTFFLKKHEREKQLTYSLPRSPFISFCSEGGKEFTNFYDFRQHNLATATPVAMGEKVFPDGTVESFLLTEDFAPYVQLEYVIRNAPHTIGGTENLEKRKKIIAGIASYARNMHDQGFNHQDFNATHVLLSGLDDNDTIKVALFDLQRVDRNRMKKIRWPIKALAEFNYSSREKAIFSDADRLFFFRSYKGKEQKSFNILDWLQWKWIEAKTNRIARHTANRHARKYR